MGILTQIRRLVENGLFYLTEHALEEAEQDNLNIYDVEFVLINGKIKRVWPKESKYEIMAKLLDGTEVGVVCKLTPGNKVRVITIYEDTN